MAGVGLKPEEANATQNLYVRPFAGKIDKDVPQISSHTVISTQHPMSEVEVLNLWPHPINVAKGSPIGIVQTINPMIKDTPQPSGTRQAQEQPNTDPNGFSATAAQACFAKSAKAPPQGVSLAEPPTLA